MKTAAIATVFCLCLNAHADLLTFDLGNPTIFGGMSGRFETPTNSSPATGGEVGVGLTYDTTTHLLDVNVAYGLFGFEPLTGDYTASHIHSGLPGVSGPIEVSLAPIHVPVGTHAGFYSGTVTLTAAQQTMLLGGELYMNVHSTAFPGGEIRGQIMPAAIPEPSPVLLLGLALAVMSIRFRSSLA